MSIILDALKKLDREKLSRRNTVTNIAVEILRPDLPRPRKRIPLYFVAILLTAIATATLTYALMLEFGLLSKSSVPIAMNPSAPSQKTAPAPLDSAPPLKPSSPMPINPPVPSQQVTPTPLSHELVSDTRDEKSQVPTKIEDSSERKKPETILSEEKVDQKVITEEAVVTPEKTKVSIEHTPPSAQPIPKESPTTPPSLKISAIVWYEEPSKRFAMVNGMIANEGSMIEGVKVEEIFPDRVRFSYNGRSFEIAIK